MRGTVAPSVASLLIRSIPKLAHFLTGLQQFGQIALCRHIAVFKYNSNRKDRQIPTANIHPTIDETPLISVLIKIPTTLITNQENISSKNIPFTECTDNGGLDFETDNENTIIDGYRFENIPSTAIMFLSNETVMLNHPDSKNVTARNNEIFDCGFGDKYGICGVAPFSICVMLWPMGNKPTGEICNNTYKLSLCKVSGEIVPFFGGNRDVNGLNEHDNKAVK